MVAASLIPGDQLSKCSLASDVLRRFGEVRIRVTGSSMLPSLWPGDLLLIRSAHLGELACGDLVLFYRHGRFFVHRVLAVTSGKVLTRGDALAAPDLPVGPDELLGRVVSIVRDGVTRQPAPLGAAGRLIAFAVGRSTIFCNILLRLRYLSRRHFSRASALAPPPGTDPGSFMTKAEAGGHGFSRAVKRPLLAAASAAAGWCNAGKTCGSTVDAIVAPPPQGLKPTFAGTPNGTAEAVPSRCFRMKNTGEGPCSS